MNELNILSKDNLIEVKKGLITFNGFEDIKAKSIMIAEYVANVEVSEDTLKEAKKTVADSNKVVKRLNDERIKIKKELLEPYNKFETQVKEIESILNDASKIVKDKVKVLTDREIEEKEKLIHELWDKKINALDNSKFYNYDEWLKPQYLNKTFKLSQVENELDEYIDITERDLEFLKEFENSHLYINKYLECRDVVETVKYVKKLDELKNDLEDEDDFFIEEKEDVSIFEIKGKANIKLVEMLLNENEIKYNKINK